MEPKEPKKRTMASLGKKVTRFFTQQPVPQAALHLSSSYFSGIRVVPPERKIKYHVLLPFQGELVHPSFYKKNIIDPQQLEEKVKEGMEKLQLSHGRIAFLLPELSQKAFVFAFDAVPKSRKETEQVLLFRIKKQIPMLPEDTRLSFQVSDSNGKKRVLVTVAREAVVREYEEFFQQRGLKLKIVGVPSLGLLNLIDRQEEKDFMLIDVEKESFTLLGVINSEVVLYRQKPFAEDLQAQEAFDRKWLDVVQEIENTANFIEDKENRKIHRHWVRLGVLESNEMALSLLKERCRCPVSAVEAVIAQNIPLKEKELLSPLIGQIL